jgi:rsbT antagonist protein RsbS
MDRVPILKIGDMLLVSIQIDLQDQSVLALQEDLAEKISTSGATGVVIDISAVAITLVELGLTLGGVRTALDLDRGIKVLNSLTARNKGASDDDSVRVTG